MDNNGDKCKIISITRSNDPVHFIKGYSMNGVPHEHVGTSKDSLRLHNGWLPDYFTCISRTEGFLKRHCTHIVIME